MNERQYQTLEDAPEYATATAALARWAENYDFPTPYTLFCDLIGFSGEEFGECWFLPSVPGPYSPPAKEELFQVDAARRFGAVYSNLIDARLGFLELGMLADALREYADRPQDVTDYVRRILESGMED
jgi:hypothetical protein